MNLTIFVGMDVSQETVEVAVQPGTGFQVTNDERGMSTAIERLQG